MIRILTGKSRELASDALRRAAENSRITANAIIPHGRFTQLSEKVAVQQKDRLLCLASDQEKLASLIAEQAVDVVLSLTVNEARAILKLWSHWPECDRSLVMDGGESAALINMVEAARKRMDLHHIETGDFLHAGGEVMCRCGHPYRAHTPIPYETSECFRRLCDGGVVKL